jgi:16S rRNA (cytosine967-C5)-methyltransferase
LKTSFLIGGIIGLFGARARSTIVQPKAFAAGRNHDASKLISGAMNPLAATNHDALAQPGGILLEIQLCAAEIFGETLAGKNLTAAFNEAFRRRDRLLPQEKAAVREVCYEGLRRLGLLEAQLNKLLLTPIRHPALRNLLLVGLAQLQFTRAKPYAIVDHAVQAAERLGQPAARGLVNAVLRNFLRRREELGPDHWTTPEARLGFPGWWVEKLKSQYPVDWERIIVCQNRHPPMTLRVNLRRTNAAEYLANLERMGISARFIGGTAIGIDPRPVAEIPGFFDGLVSVQDAGAQYAALLLDVRDGQRILDACAAPGGKTGQLLELVDADVVAIDSDGQRLDRVRENLERLGLHATLAVGDAAQPLQWWDGKAFDRVLVDAPCSASGVARRHPDIRWNRRQSDLGRFAEGQGRILDGLWQVLETSGKLLYATCSLFRDENEAVVEGFLDRHADASVAPFAPGAPAGGRILPDENRDGFFYALVEKR